MDKPYISKIIKVGTSCAVIIPRDVLVASKLQRGDLVVHGFTREGYLFLQALTPEQIAVLKPKVVKI